MTPAPTGTAHPRRGKVANAIASKRFGGVGAQHARAPSRGVDTRRPLCHRRRTQSPAPALVGWTTTAEVQRGENRSGWPPDSWSPTSSWIPRSTNRSELARPRLPAGPTPSQARDEHLGGPTGADRPQPRRVISPSRRTPPGHHGSAGCRSAGSVRPTRRALWADAVRAAGERSFRTTRPPRPCAPSSRSARAGCVRGGVRSRTTARSTAAPRPPPAPSRQRGRGSS
jgi:hypothetical protein